MLEWYPGLTGIPVDTLRRVEAGYRVAREAARPRQALAGEAVEQPWQPPSPLLALRYGRGSTAVAGGR